MDNLSSGEFWLECNEAPRLILAMLKETPQTMYTQVQIAAQTGVPVDELGYWLLNLYALGYIVSEIHSGFTWYGLVTHG